MKRIRPMAVRLVGLAYLMGLVFFAFKPFRLVPDCGNADAAVAWNEDRTAVRIAPGGALEEKQGVVRMRAALVESGKISLEVVLQTASLEQGGPARIVSFSRDPMCRNFTLAQEGNALVFRLRTTCTDNNGMNPCLVVPGVFDTARCQHLVVTYDGARTRLYIDGVASPASEALTGGFENWGRNHALTLGDEPQGERLWRGDLYSVMIYDRALEPDEVRRLAGNDSMKSDSVAVLKCAFGEGVPVGIEPLHYRNIFAVSDRSIFNRSDCFANIIGFVPLAPLVFFALPLRLRRRRVLAALVFPVLVGGAVSGIFEWTQCYLIGRVPSALDIAYNVSGSLLGGLILWMMLLGCRKEAQMDLLTKGIR